MAFGPHQAGMGLVGGHGVHERHAVSPVRPIAPFGEAEPVPGLFANPGNFNSVNDNANSATYVSLPQHGNSHINFDFNDLTGTGPTAFMLGQYDLEIDYPVLEPQRYLLDGSALHRQTTADQTMSSSNHFLAPPQFFAANATGQIAHDDFHSFVSGFDAGIAYAAEGYVQNQAGSQLTVPTLGVKIQSSWTGMEDSPTSSRAFIKEITDGRFQCSEGCPTLYARAGDCRRHLKKHNGPFFHCTQGSCDMKFYRHDKLRTHLKQGHCITATVPRRGRRHVN